VTQVTEPVTFRNTELTVGLAVLGGGMALLLLAFAVVAEDSVAVRAGAAVLGLVSAWFYLGRMARASVRAGDDGVVIRNPLRTVRVDWPEIESFEAREQVGGVQPCVALRDGRKVAMWAVQSPRRRLRAADDTAGRAVTRLNRLLEDRYPDRF
jgi:PH (Pleckstrin Homology) domain-containing protein